MPDSERESAPFSMPKAYEPGGVEERIYRLWLEGGYFTPRIDPAKQPFTIIMPPPNVTGELHLGHAITATIEDILVRWHRMLGEPTLWLPGSDHSGIYAQVVVERLLAREGLTRHQLGREAFLERMWEWMRKYGRIIAEQHKRLGASCDWSRERFTMDPGPSRAVRTHFVRLFNKGLIYRGERIVNWCLRCATVLSDLEVAHQEVRGRLYYVRYPFAEGEGHITVATTRPETILGDTAVAVHPQDERYRDLVGRRVVVPSCGRIVPIIADEAVDRAFGTGAVKITPAHDPDDFEIGQRHGLPSVNVLNPDGTMNAQAGPYQGLDRFICRDKLLEELKGKGLLEKTEEHLHSVGHCDRCRTVVEPIASRQWFIAIKPLAEPAIAAVREGRIRIIPERFTKVYLNWMEGIRDWCISRQIWWGHRIPVWYCDDCGHFFAALEDPAACERCRSKHILQDPDVLDTWFSSALWPHSTLGWPEDTEDLRYFYPTSVMETGYDILFFWVARMIMMGLENMGEVPFRAVYLHGLIRVEGEKMSKSRGNVVNPLEMIERYGTDALRFSLITGTSPGNDTQFSQARIEAGRNFANKLWNAARYVASAAGPGGLVALPKEGPEREGLGVAERWILSRLQRAAGAANALLGDYQLGEAVRTVYEFLWGEFCDWYVEISKVELRREGDGPSVGRAVLATLGAALEASLRLLHPFMPFVTEEVWQRLFAPSSPHPALIVADYPQANESLVDEGAERQMELLIGLVRAVRNARSEFGIDPARWLPLVVAAGADAGWLRSQADVVSRLARARPLEFHQALAQKPRHALAAICQGTEAYLPLEGVLDLEAELRRLEAERAEAKADVARLEAKLASADFVAKAPEAVVARERERLAAARDRFARLSARLEALR